jgi:predicted DNA-binding antitoxin AbrB/MazE fold protein
MFAEILTMAITFEAIYENGVLKPAQPLPLKEHEKVSVTVEPARAPIWERIAARVADIPPEECDKLPPGSAAQIDEYLYGHPKLPE